MSGSFKIGDVVRLRSGGPAMTVGGEHDKMSGGWWCCWISADGEPYSGRYESAALQPAALPVNAATCAPRDCWRCGTALLFSARERGDNLCGPCSRGHSYPFPVHPSTARGAEFKVPAGQAGHALRAWWAAHNQDHTGTCEVPTCPRCEPLVSRAASISEVTT